MTRAFEQELAKRYSGLSAKLRQAADFIVDRPFDVATRSLRSISADLGVAPATFTRLARALEYSNYEEIREEMRNSIGRSSVSFSDGLERLQNGDTEAKGSFASQHFDACQTNLDSLRLDINTQELDRVVDRLSISRNVVLMGAMGSTGVAEYMSYAADFIADNWKLAGRMGASLSSSLITMNSQDTFVVITKTPHANKAVKAAASANANEAFVVVITDSHKCPALAYASAYFIIPTDSSHFFSSYVATLALVETIIGMLAAKTGNAAWERIKRVEESNYQLEYLSEC